MDFTEQGRRAVTQHSEGLEEGKTCIDCHKGIAHQLPDMRSVDPTSALGIKQRVPLITACAEATSGY